DYYCRVWDSSSQWVF
nr:immunoglobulin light chain junction region [Macaca mulatta]